jgi:putative membrane protein
MRSFTFATWLVGVGLLALLFANNDFSGLLKAAGGLEGWLALIIAWHAVPLVCDVAAWQLLFARRPPLARLFWLRWVGESANGILPVPHLGELLRVKLAHDYGSDLVDAGASVLADVTLGLASQVLFLLVGLVFFALHGGAGALSHAMATGAALALFGLSFYAFQRSRFLSRAIETIGRRTGAGWRLFDGASARRLEDALHIVYGRRAAVLGGLVWRLIGWFAGAGEIWLVTYGLGHPIGIAEAVVLESLSQAARAAAFIIPGGLGVQDGTLMVLSAQLGLGPELGLLVSLVKRLRELALGVPGLAVGYAVEWRRWNNARTTLATAEKAD